MAREAVFFVIVLVFYYFFIIVDKLPTIDRSKGIKELFFFFSFFYV